MFCHSAWLSSLWFSFASIIFMSLLLARFSLCHCFWLDFLLSTRLLLLFSVTVSPVCEMSVPPLVFFIFYLFKILFINSVHSKEKTVPICFSSLSFSVWRHEASFLRYISFLISYKQSYSFINRCELFVLFNTLLNNFFFTTQLQRHEFQNEKLTSCALFSIFRSICQNMAVLRQHKGGEEEDEHQNALAQPCLQWVVHLRDSVGEDPWGVTGGHRHGLWQSGSQRDDRQGHPGLPKRPNGDEALERHGRQTTPAGGAVASIKRLTVMPPTLPATINPSVYSAVARMQGWPFLFPLPGEWWTWFAAKAEETCTPQPQEQALFRQLSVIRPSFAGLVYSANALKPSLGRNTERSIKE